MAATNNTMNSTEGKQLLTIRQTVRETGLSEHFLRQAYKRGELPHIMSGTRILVNVPKLREWIDEQTARATAR